MPRMFESKMVRAEPRRLPVAIFRMNSGMLIPVGQAPMHGASWQYRQRFASASAWGV